MTKKRSRNKQKQQPVKPAEPVMCQPALPGFPFLAGVVALALLTLLMFADVLFVADPPVLSNARNDLASQFVYWRQFGFGQLRQGNLALWNPNIFSGMPYLGGFQSALLYPPNWLYLIFPLAPAINWGIALHVFLMGLFMSAWAWRRGLHPAAAFLSGALLMFCGAHFLHIYAGHLPNLCTMVWAPALFLCIDEITGKRSPGWALAGAGVVAMMILAGHPQYVYYTAVSAGLYCLCLLIGKWLAWRSVMLLAAMAAGALALSAVQTLTGLDAAGESVRSAGMPYNFAAMFSFPPENILTLITPAFFGNMDSQPYWGRCYLWEMSLFVGVSGLMLALFGVVHGRKKIRRYAGVLTLLLLILALGSHTPLFRVLYSIVPGYDKFRGNSKFVFHASIFLMLLSGIGADHLLRRQRIKRLWPMALGGLAIVAVLAALFINASSAAGAESGWGRLMRSVAATGECYVPPENYSQDAFVEEAGAFAAKSLLITAVCAAVVCALLFMFEKARRVSAALLIALAIIEVFAYARLNRPVFDLSITRNARIEEYTAEHGGDYRILNLNNPNQAMILPVADIWGYDPGVLRRYAELVSYTQGIDPDEATQYVQFKSDHPLYSMLRCRAVFIPQGDGSLQVMERDETLPRALLVDSYVVSPSRDRTLERMTAPGFDPRQTVILESEPSPKPQPQEQPGTVEIVETSTDFVTVEVDLESPSILLVTGPYSKGWQVRPLEESGQEDYRVQPANHALMAVALDAGHHLLRLEYLPLAFRAGRVISLAALILYGLAAVYLLMQRFKDRRDNKGSSKQHEAQEETEPASG